MQVYVQSKKTYEIGSSALKERLSFCDGHSPLNSIWLPSQRNNTQPADENSQPPKRVHVPFQFFRF